jgi:hypothetical protein
MTLIHWNYLLALEDDLDKLSRYIEFHKDNFKAYSIETARILMLATQEVDVLMKQLCKKNKNMAKTEDGYRKFIPKKYPELLDLKVSLAKYNLSCDPFSYWKKGKTPTWWTANNKIKHERDKKFKMASLENALEAISALLLTNIYFYLEVKKKNGNGIFPNPKLLSPEELITAISPATFGFLNNYKLP